MNIINKVLVVVAIASVLALVISVNRYSNLSRKYEASMTNIKAYDTELSGLKDKANVYKLTIGQLNYYNDSLLNKMNEVRKELGIKDKRLDQLQYELSYGKRSDTLVLTDTIFRNPEFRLDTIIGDKWFKSHLLLQYPGTIAISPEIEIERYVFISGKRETINPPNKFFLFRWFQKKHTIAEVQLKEMNPYIKNKNQRFIQIIK